MALACRCLRIMPWMVPGSNLLIMEMAIFRRVVVLLDPLAPRQGVFAHALDWARRLRLPLAGIFAPNDGDRTRADEEHVSATDVDRPLIQKCAEACTRSNVPWEVRVMNGFSPFELERFLEPNDLLLIDRVLPMAQKRAILRRSFSPGVLLCPDNWLPLTRVLLLNQSKPPREGFLKSAAELCRRLEVETVVLTIARSEHQARVQQQAAQDALAGHGVSFDFDFVVGPEVPVAVAGVARWRRCQAVVMDRENAASWWRRLRSSTFERLIGLPDPLAFLSLSSAVALVSPREPLSTTPACTNTVSGVPASLRESLSAGTMGVNPARLPGP